MDTPISHRRFRKVDCRPDKIYLLHIFQDNVREAAKSFNLPILELEENNNHKFTPVQNAIYVIDDFEACGLFECIEKTTNTWILGPTALIQISQNQRLHFRTKPLYSACMNGLCFFINCPFQLKLRVVRLVKWMGGMFSENADGKVTHMISTTTLGGAYRYCNTFNVPVLTPDWVEACWQRRHLLGFLAVDIQSKFKLPAFSGLKISFEGFPNQKILEMKELTSRHSGTLVSSNDATCTHVVCADSVTLLKLSTSNCFKVSPDWFWSCIDNGERSDESHFRCYMDNGHEMMESSSESDDEEEQEYETIPEIISEVPIIQVSQPDEEDTSKILSMNLKSKHNMRELYETELSYVTCLNHLLQIQRKCVEEYPNDEPILNQIESTFIFGNLYKINRIHKGLCGKMYDCLQSWNDLNGGLIISNAFKDVKDELLKEYVTYSLRIEESRSRLKTLKNNNIRFQQLLNKHLRNKEDVTDLFIRPIQRLGSISLILKEMAKNTPDYSPGQEGLQEAINILRNILQDMDTEKDNNDRMKIVFDTFQQISDCPPDLIKSQRKFILKFSAHELISKSQQHTIGSKLVFFLFDDVLEVVKVRSKYQNQVDTIDDLDSKEKPYKHILLLPLAKIINVLMFDDNDNSQYIFGLKVAGVRMNNLHTLHCFRYSECEWKKLDEVLVTMCKTLSKYDGAKSEHEFVFDKLRLRHLYSESLVAPPSVADRIIDNLPRGKKTKRRRSRSCSELPKCYL